VDLVREAATLGHQLAGVWWPGLALGVALHLGKRAARARAWQNIVRAAHPEASLQYPVALGACLAAVGVSAVAPIRGGELLRVMLVRWRLPGTSVATLTATLAAESVLDVVVAAGLGATVIGVGLLPGLPGPGELADRVLSPPAGLAALGVLAVVSLAVSRLAGPRLGRLGAAFRQGFAAFGEPRHFVLGVASWQALAWALRLGSVFAFLLAFRIEATLATAALVLAAQLLSTLVPLTWAGLGAQQALLVLALGATAGAREVVALGVGMQAATMLVNVAAGGAALSYLAGTLRVRSLLRAVQT
jgi:hypothetical protein